MTDSIDDYISKLRTVSLSELESVLVEIENLQDPTLFRELLNSVVWIPAERRDRDEIYMRGFGRLEIPFSDRFSARVARPEWQQFIALRLLCSSPIHQELRRSLVHLSPPRINLSGLNLPDFSRLPNLRSLHLYLDHEPLKPAVLALLNLEELSLFGPGFRSLEGVEKADRLRELDLRWQDSPSLEPLRDKRELKHANLVFHQGTLDLAPLASTTLERAWIFGPDLRTEELLNAPRLRELKVTTEGSFELGSATSKLETLECDRSTSITLREAPCLREILVIGGYPDGVRLEVLHPLPSLELLELIAYSDPPPPLTLCPALRYLRVRPYQVDTFKRLPGLEACSQLREVELWEPFPTIPELKDLPRLQRIEPRVKEKEDFDTRTRSTIDFDEFGEGLESIFHSETDLEEARSKLQEWLALDGRPEFLDQLLQECRLLSSGQVWVPPGSYLRGHPDERWQTCAWSDRPQNTASERRALVRFLMSVSTVPSDVAEQTYYSESSESDPLELAHLSVYSKLQAVKLSGPSFRNLEELLSLDQLKSLTLDGCLGDDLSSLPDLHDLEHLVLSQHRKIPPLQSLKGIEKLTSLKRLELRLAGNPNLGALRETEIEELILLVGDVPKLPAIKSLKKLVAPDP